MAHEALLLLFRNRPTFAAELLHDALGLALPAYAEARIESPDLTEVIPRERRADQIVLLLDQGTPCLAIVVEAQLGIDDEKRYTWPAYLIGVRMRYRCPSCLLVVTTDERVAAWSASPVEIGPCGSSVRPLVLGPEAVPVIDTAEQARRSPELSVLSAMAHGRGEAGRAIGLAAIAAATGLAGESSGLYADIVISCLSKAARRAVEEVMANGAYEYQSDFAKKYLRVGAIHERARSVLTVLEARGVAISEAVRTRVLESHDFAELDLWLRRAATVPSAAAIFDGGS